MMWGKNIAGGGESKGLNSVNQLKSTAREGEQYS